MFKTLSVQTVLRLSFAVLMQQQPQYAFKTTTTWLRGLEFPFVFY